VQELLLRPKTGCKKRRLRAQGRGEGPNLQAHELGGAEIAWHDWRIGVYTGDFEMGIADKLK